MVLDIIVVTIIVLSMVFGFRKGFIYTFTHTLGWLGSMIIAFFLFSSVRTFLSDHTRIYDSIYSSLAHRFDSGTDSMLNSVDSLPRIISGGMHSAAEGAADTLAANLADLIFSLLCFALVLFLVKAIFFAITLLLSKKENRGFVGFLDGLLGLVAGALRGVILVFILLALLLPAVNLSSPEDTQIVLNSLDNSYISRSLYDSNFIVLLVHDILG